MTKDLSDQLSALKRALDDTGLKAGVIQSSLCKVHLPDRERMAREMQKLDGIIRASEILETKLVRSFLSRSSLYSPISSQPAPDSRHSRISCRLRRNAFR